MCRETIPKTGREDIILSFGQHSFICISNSPLKTILGFLGHFASFLIHKQAEDRQMTNMRPAIDEGALHSEGAGRGSITILALFTCQTFTNIELCFLLLPCAVILLKTDALSRNINKTNYVSKTDLSSLFRSRFFRRHDLDAFGRLAFDFVPNPFSFRGAG